MGEKKERYSVAGFEGGGRGSEPRSVGGFYKLESTRKLTLS